MPAAGLKSGAMLLRETPPHFMFMYDLRDGIRQVVVAKTDDSGALSRWSLTNQTLVAKRSAMWDAGLIEPGPPPLTLDDGQQICTTVHHCSRTLLGLDHYWCTASVSSRIQHRLLAVHAGALLVYDPH